jgi:peptidoglycan L-alanyl-D-glutamate endopeptidase CwlK
VGEIRLVSYVLGQRSLARLIGVHPELERLVKAAIRISKIDFAVVEGVRSLAQQREYFRLGKSRTLKSKHLTGHAVDLMPYGDLDGDGDFDQVDKAQAWEKHHFLPINDAMQQAAATLGIRITWGGHWGWDFPHFEIDPAKYPFP